MMKRIPNFGAAALLVALHATAVAATPLTMKAAVVENGAADIRSLPTPTPGAGEVLIKLHAAGVNPVDWKTAAGYRPVLPPREGSSGTSTPSPATSDSWVAGFDCAGVIEKLGSQTDGWQVGDAVIVFLEKRGAYAEYAVAPVKTIARKPDALSFEQAAGVPTTASAAWAVLVDSANVKSGQRVLVHGGAGGVGSAAVQIAKARDAYVIATASPRNHDFLRSLGADEVIDYTSGRFEERVKDVDIAVNTVNAETATRSVHVVKKDGLVVSVAGAADDGVCKAAGVRCLLRSREGTPIGDVLTAIADLAAAGKYKVNVDKTFPLAEFEQAWQASRVGHTRGKIVLTLR